MSIITGDNAANFLLGTDDADTIYGLGGNDYFVGHLGVDTLIGGTGDDTYIYDGSDVFVEKVDEGTDTVVSVFNVYNLSANVENLTLSQPLTGSIPSTSGTTLPMAVVGVGNDLNNIITGNMLNNQLDGGLGADTLIGGAGNDVYRVDNAGDLVTEAVDAGIDTVVSTISYTLAANVENLNLTGSVAINGTGNALANALIGNTANNILTGGAGNDTLDGAAGNDSLYGGDGDDVYVVDSFRDYINEVAGAGTDSVYSTASSYILANNVENLYIGGTGNNNGMGNIGANIIIGNAANNVLDGSFGADTLQGGLGNDQYVVDNVGDVVIEAANQGIDEVFFLTASYTLGANLEKLTFSLSGTGVGIGNNLDNTITGNTHNNVINGGEGADTLLGGAGNDTYYVDNAGDVVIEDASIGIDTVISSISYKLSANVENLTLTGTGTRNGVGNDLANYIVGNGGNNILTGGKGGDTYNLGRTSQHDTLIESDSTAGTTDTLRFAADVHYDQLWFKQIGNDLEVDIIGTTNAATVKNFFYSSANHIEVFRSGDGKVLTDTHVQNLVSAMAGMAEPAAGQTVLTAAQQAALAPVFAANWT